MLIRSQSARPDSGIPTPYVPPAIETVLTAEQLLSEVVYGGELISCGPSGQTAAPDCILPQDIAEP